MKVALNIKVEDTLKKDFEKIIDKLGISLSGAFIMFMNQVVIQEKIPFELTTKRKEEDTDISLKKEDVLIEEQKNNDRQMEILLKYMELLANKK